MFGGDLGRDPPDVRRASLERPRRDRRVRNPVPPRGVEGIRVVDDARHGPRRLQAAIAAKEPESIALDRAAVGDARVVGVDDAGRFLEIRSRGRRAQRVVQVVASGPVTRVVDERRAAERVAAGSRHEVHHRPADIRLAEAAGDGHRHLIDVDGIQDVGRHAAAVERRRDGHAVDRHAPFVDRAAARREEGHRRRRGERAVVDRQAGDGIQQRADGAVSRNGRDDLGAEHRFAPCVLDVDHRGLTRDRDRFRERCRHAYRLESSAWSCRRARCCSRLTTLKPDSVNVSE